MFSFQRAQSYQGLRPGARCDDSDRGFDQSHEHILPVFFHTKSRSMWLSQVEYAYDMSKMKTNDLCIEQILRYDWTNYNSSLPFPQDKQNIQDICLAVQEGI